MFFRNVSRLVNLIGYFIFTLNLYFVFVFQKNFLSYSLVAVIGVIYSFFIKKLITKEEGACLEIIGKTVQDSVEILVVDSKDFYAFATISSFPKHRVVISLLCRGGYATGIISHELAHIRFGHCILKQIFALVSAVDLVRDIYQWLTGFLCSPVKDWFQGRDLLVVSSVLLVYGSLGLPFCNVALALLVVFAINTITDVIFEISADLYGCDSFSIVDGLCDFMALLCEREGSGFVYASLGESYPSSYFRRWYLSKILLYQNRLAI